jgi:hypothetical protein
MGPTKPAALALPCTVGGCWKRESLHVKFTLARVPVLLPAPCSVLPALVRAQMRRIIQQEVARATHRVIGISRLGHRRARVEVVHVIARIGTAAAARRRLAATSAISIAAYRRVGRPRALIGAVAFMPVHVTMWMAMAAAAPGAFGIAGRAVVLSWSVARSAIVTAITAKQAAIAAHAAAAAATILQAAAASALATGTLAATFAVAVVVAAFAFGPRRHLRCFDVARLLAAVATRITAAVIIGWTDRSAPGARKHRQREHDKRAFHRSPLWTWVYRSATLKRAELGAHDSGRYHPYRRHNRQNPTKGDAGGGGQGNGAALYLPPASRILHPPASSICPPLVPQHASATTRDPIKLTKRTGATGFASAR